MRFSTTAIPIRWISGRDRGAGAGGAITSSDRVIFRSVTSVVIALGGENQVPADPPLEPSNHGTFQLAITLEQKGYDVHMYDEDVVPANGAGAAYNEVLAAVRSRMVTGVAIYGYSHGGGSTNDLARKLNADRASIGTFSIDFTAYVDGIDNDGTTSTAYGIMPSSA